MTVEKLIEELKRLPPNVMKQELVVALAYDRRVVEEVKWTGGYVVLSTGGRSA